MRNVVLMMALGLAGASTGQAQGLGVSLGAQAGLTTYGLSGKLAHSPYGKVGVGGGVLLRWQLSSWLAVQPEVNLTQQGAGYEVTGASAGPAGGRATGTITLTYLNVPVLVKLYLTKRLSVQLGPQLGLLLKGREVGPPAQYRDANNQIIDDFDGDADVAASYANDLALVSGMGYDLPWGLSFNARLAYGLRDVNRNAWERELSRRLGSGGIYNRGAELTVAYFFRQPPAQ
jgi:hypothetical protein